MKKYLTDYLPIKDPLQYEPGENWFYKHILQHLIKDIVKITCNGIPIDLDKVKEIENTVTDVIKTNTELLDNNPIVKEFVELKNKELLEQRLSSVVKEEFDINKNSHKQTMIDVIVEELLGEKYTRPKGSNWTLAKLKILATKINSIILQILVDKDYNNSLLLKYKNIAVERLYEAKKAKRLEGYKPYQINYNSTKQIGELFNYIGIESNLRTKGGQESYNKEVLQEMLDEIKNMEDYND